MTINEMISTGNTEEYIIIQQKLLGTCLARNSSASIYWAVLNMPLDNLKPCKAFDRAGVISGRAHVYGGTGKEYFKHLQSVKSAIDKQSIPVNPYLEHLR